MRLKFETTSSDYNRFLKFVELIPFHECWEWSGFKDVSGYGKFRTDGKNIMSHRFSYKYHKGDIQHNMDVLHKCDNPPCVNPNHLFLGTQKENMADMVKKGRQYRPSKKSHCPQGHEYSGNNLHLYFYKGKTHRLCKTCQNGKRERS